MFVTPFRPQLQAANLQAIQITELETEFAKIEGEKATPTRYIRSQQVKQAKLAEQGGGGDGNIQKTIKICILYITYFNIFFTFQLEKLTYLTCFSPRRV